MMDFGYRSDDVDVSGPSQCQGTGREFFATNKSKKPQSALVCRHEFIPHGQSGYEYVRTFMPQNLASGERKSLGCMVNYTENYMQAAYSEVGTFTPDVDIERTPYKALVLVINPAAHIMMLYNRHKVKTVEVSFDRGPHFKQDRYVTEFLDPMGADILGEDGGVTMARYTNPYQTGNTNPCTTFPDGTQVKGAKRKSKHVVHR